VPPNGITGTASEILSKKSIPSPIFMVDLNQFPLSRHDAELQRTDAIHD